MSTPEMIPPITPEAAYLRSKVIFTIRIQNVLDHIVPQAREYLGVAEGGQISAEFEALPNGDLAITLTKG